MEFHCRDKLEGLVRFLLGADVVPITWWTPQLGDTCLPQTVVVDRNGEGWRLILTWTTENSMQRTLLYYGVLWAKISQYVDIGTAFLSESLLYKFLNLSTRVWGSVIVSLSLQHDCSGWTEEWWLHFVGSVLPGSYVLSVGNMNQTLWLACFFKMEELSGCGTTRRKCWLLTDSLPPPPDTYTHWHENEHYFIYISWHNDFIKGIIA